MGLAIDVIVPTHNGWAHTRDCLRHLRAQTAAHRVIVADDGSSDGTPERVAGEFPEAEVRALGANRGFAAACNAGARAGSGDVVVLLNNDVDARPAFLEALVAPLAGDPALGSCAALLVRPGGRLIDSVGLAADPTLAGFPRHQGLPVGAAGRERPALLGPSGGAAAYRREAWEAMGGLDEAIFLYQEDLDLALRLRAGGWGAAAAIDAVGVHHGSATTGRTSAFQRRHAGFSRGYLLRRYGVLRSRSGPRALLTEALVSAGDIALSRDLAALRGRLAGWRAGGSAEPLPTPRDGVERSIGLRESLRLRGVDLRLARAGRTCPAPRLPAVSAPTAHVPGTDANPRGADVNLRSGPQLREYEAIAARIARDRPGLVLDWGCGHGQMSHLLRQSGLEVSSFDFRGPDSPDVEVTLPRYPDVRAFISGDPRRLPYDDASFDAVLSCGVLEHVEDPDASLEELARVLRPGGVLYVYKLPNRFSYLEHIAKRMGLYFHGIEPFDRLYTPATARALLARHGYAVHELHLANMLPLTLDAPLLRRPRAAGAYWRANRSLAGVPALNRLATNVELIATAP